LKDNLNFYQKKVKILQNLANVQSDLKEALVKLNQVPLALVPIDNDPDNENVFCIYIEMTGTYFILLPFIV
jgi:hypothetical protein